MANVQHDFAPVPFQDKQRESLEQFQRVVSLYMSNAKLFPHENPWKFAILLVDEFYSETGVLAMPRIWRVHKLMAYFLFVIVGFVLAVAFYISCFLVFGSFAFPALPQWNATTCSWFSLALLVC